MIFIGIAGPSGAGKTTLSNYLSSKYKEQFEHLRQDDYHRHPDTFAIKDGLKNWADPANIRFEDIYRDLKKLQTGQTVFARTFAWQPGEQSYPYTLEPKEYILVDGCYILLNQDVADMLDLKIYIDIPTEISLQRRQVRDGHRFNLTEFDKKITIPEFEKHGLIQRTQAQFIVDGTKPPKDVATMVKQIIDENHIK